MNMLKIGNKGQLSNLTGLAWGIVFLGIIIVVGALVVSGFQNTNAVYNQTTANSTANQVLSGLSLFGTYIGLIVTIGVMAVIIGLVLMAFGGAAGGHVGRVE